MIKFRAWDKETNKYFEPTYQAYMGRLEELTIGLSGRLQKRTYRGVVDESVFPGRYVVEQFTGLKDVNGKDIYEGDIIEVTSQYWGMLGNRYEVKFKQDVFFVNCDLLSKISPSISVIGNVHANPELLEEEQ